MARDLRGGLAYSPPNGITLVNTFLRTLFSAVAVVWATLSPVWAAPVTMTYTGTIASLSGGAIPAGVNVGGTAVFSVVMDNGGVGVVSQTWDFDDILSVTMNFGNGARVTVFSSPLDAPYDVSGTFKTDASGDVTSVISMGGYVVDERFTSNGPGGRFAWFINGLNNVYQELDNGADMRIALNNVGGIVQPANWSVASVNAVPEPTTLILVGLSLLGVVAARRRRH